jgi:hypothetical protein
MSYPKRHPVVAKESERDTKTQQRREQMKNLLVTKFRGKFGVSGENSEVDAIIREEVEVFLNNEQMSE